ncbi:hypothetical protein ACFL9T_06545 [Thermodesulfobacteriota bacterium]
MSASRIISGVITAVLLLWAILDPHSEGDISVFLGLLIPVAMIWFPDVVNDFTLGKWTQGGVINKPTPPALVSALGWLLLVVLIGVGMKRWFF